MCPWSGSCFDRFVLLETGEVKPVPEHWQIDAWASWPQCPRNYMGSAHVYLADQGVASLAEVCRWAIECGVHQRGNLTARGSRLLREWTQIRGIPEALRIHIATKKSGK